MTDTPVSELLSIAADGLAREASRLDAEQAVRGLDAMTEVDLHARIHDVFARAGFGVVREQPYPGLPGGRPRHAERERCDLVLLPSPTDALLDPVASRLERDRAEGTLFAMHVGMSHSGVAVGDAVWIEVKCVGQFVEIDGCVGANRTYAGELVRAINTDVRKLSRDPYIRRGVALLVLFTADDEVARHDVGMALHRCLDKGCPIGSPHMQAFGVSDRIGNGSCLVTLVPARAEDQGP